MIFPQRKKTLINILLFTLILLFAFLLDILDISFFPRIFFLKNIRLSLAFCICLSFLCANEKSVAIAFFCGLFFDIYSMSSPFNSFLYLYISLGCVWCKSLFLKFRGFTLLLLGLIILFIYKVLCGVLLSLSAREFVLTFEFLINALLFAFSNSIVLPIFYSLLKRVKF